jgi:transposase
MWNRRWRRLKRRPRRTTQRRKARPPTADQSRRAAAVEDQLQPRLADECTLIRCADDLALVADWPVAVSPAPVVDSGQRAGEPALGRCPPTTFLPHLPREGIVIDVEDKTCAYCGGLKHRMGEDVSERLDVMPAQLKVIVTRRPKYACRACAGEVTQAPAPERLIENSIPTEALVAYLLVAKYADHTPLYRQAQIYARHGITLDRSTLADSVGRATFALRPVHARLLDR